MLWMLDNQGGRRNLADIDKISIATKKEVIIAAQAKERQRLSAKDEEGMSKSRDPSAPILTRREAAKEAGVGQTKYDEGKVILDAVASGEAPKEAGLKVCPKVCPAGKHSPWPSYGQKYPDLQNTPYPPFPHLN